MKGKTFFSGLVLLAFTLVAVSPVMGQSDSLISAYESNAEEFTRVEIGNKIVYYKQRLIGQAIVEKDLTVYQFDKDTKQLLDKKVSFRPDLPESLPEVIAKEQAEALAEGEVQFSQLYFISPESDVFPLDPTPENPCWVVRNISDGRMIVTIIDAVTGDWLGYGIPPPYEGFSLGGPNWGSCDPYYTAWAENAEDWFETMGYNTEMVDNPPDSKVQSHIQSTTTAMFYELAHGSAYSFHNICPDTESITWSEVETWIWGYTKMPFTFLGSCGGMCDTDHGTLSYAFRKGSTIDTTSVGYCGMAETYCATCWDYSIEWQTILFMYMNDPSYTVYGAYNQAMALYPVCAPTEGDCMRFVGDTGFKVKPVVERGTQENPCCNVGPYGVGGCVDSAIEAAVCAVDPYCCTNRWDSICVGRVESVYGDTCDCCELHSDATGCYASNLGSGHQEDISDCVCAGDPYCCNHNWDSLCVARVESFGCGICPDVCPTPVAAASPHPLNNASDVSLETILSWNCSMGDDFEDGNINEYTVLGDTHSVTEAAAHDGSLGLESSWGGWIYRDDPAAQVAQGETISFWVRVLPETGRNYAGFGASAAGTYSVITAVNTDEFLIQLNQGYGYMDIGTSPQTWNDQWYRVEVQWGSGGQIVARLYDSDGATLLNTVSALDNTFTAGGIAFRAFGSTPSGYLDTVQICESPVPEVAAISEALKERFNYYREAEPQEADRETNESLVWDEANQAYVPPAESLQYNQKSTTERTEVPAGYSIVEGALVEGMVQTPAEPTAPQRSVELRNVSSKFINFDDQTEPCYFADTTRLTDRYQTLGVIFEGPGGNDGGAILDECSNFGVSGHSSPNFLAFNSGLTMSDGGIPKGPETILFATPVSEVQAIVGSNSGAGQTLTMAAYDAESALVNSATVTLASQMKAIKVSGQGIVRAVISTTASVFVLDDLTWAQWCPVTYDVYFGTTGPTGLICSDTQSTFCDPGVLGEATTYSWQVVTKSPGGETAGPIWTFSTTFPELCSCDLNGSGGSCNFFDWLIFITDWGNCTQVGCSCDLNLDGSCNFFDWLVFITDWGRTDCPASSRCAGQSCGNYTFDCNPQNSSCACVKVAEGYGSCSSNAPCPPPEEACTKSADCPPGYICAVGTCCGYGVCAVDNDCAPGAATPAVQTGSAGPTIFGR
jgi:hypothetical protein